jgi:hypothetical protein
VVVLVRNLLPQQLQIKMVVLVLVVLTLLVLDCILMAELQPLTKVMQVVEDLELAVVTMPQVAVVVLVQSAQMVQEVVHLQ